MVETLRKEFGIAGELTSFDFVTVTLDPDADEPVERKRIRVEFLRAGEKVIAEIDRENRMTEVTHKYKGWAGVATDLHRGNRGNVTNEVKFTGKVWSLLIDATCFLLLIIAATGLVLWWSLKSRGKWGALLLLLGTATTFAVYYWFVP